MEGDFDVTVPLWRIVRMLAVCVMVCRVIERRVRMLWVSDFSFWARRGAIMFVMLSMTMISMPSEDES